ncbi:MAG: RidA family protein, partial [Myxococcota bacterium]|nr:RidA family protein [Myxococcota bacterium]
MPGRIDARLAELGLTLPPPATPAANYVPTVRTGNLVYVAGQVPVRDGTFLYQGRVGVDFTVEEGQQAARLVACNILSQLRAA